MSVDHRELRRLVAEKTAALPDEPVDVLLSGGVDSTSVTIALALAGKRVTAHAFMVDGRVSEDFSMARIAARRLGVPFKAVILPRDREAVLAVLRHLAVRHGARKKTDFECGWPRIHAIRHHLDAPVLATGDGADGYFGVSKRAMLHHRGSVEAMDAWRRTYYADENRAQRRMLADELADRGARLFAPYFDPDVAGLFRGKSWDECNRPRQKQVIIDAFPELRSVLPRVRPHVNLHLGDSMVAETVRAAVTGSRYDKGRGGAVAAYNDFAAWRPPA